MTQGLRRFHEYKDPHFITFSCYHRKPLLTPPEAKNIFVAALERVRRTYALRVFGYVVMPEHVHLLLSEPECLDRSEYWTSRSCCFALSGLEDVPRFRRLPVDASFLRNHSQYSPAPRFKTTLA